MKPTQKPIEIDIAKMAVIIDCKGHIAIGVGPKHPSHQLQVPVGSEVFVLPDWCQARLGRGYIPVFLE
jgi:hypothetical protein